jgi:hypothetical protein
MTAEDPPAPPALASAVIDELERLALALHDARLRAQALCSALEAAWTVHAHARHEAERAGLLPPLHG